MARQKSALTAQVWARISQKELKILLDLAEKAGLNKSAMIRFCIQKALDIPIEDFDKEEPDKEWEAAQCNPVTIDPSFGVS